MLGQMMTLPLTISSVLDFAARFHGAARLLESPGRTSTPRWLNMGWPDKYRHSGTTVALQ